MIPPASFEVVGLTALISYQPTRFLSSRLGKKRGVLQGLDVHKLDMPLVAEMGGSAVRLAAITPLCNCYGRRLRHNSSRGDSNMISSPAMRKEKRSMSGGRDA